VSTPAATEAEVRQQRREQALAQLTTLLQNDLLTKQWGDEPMNRERGQLMAVSALRNSWLNKRVSLSNGEVMTITHIERGTGSDENFIELLITVDEFPRVSILGQITDRG
jgi:hypothetical protein